MMSHQLDAPPDWVGEKVWRPAGGDYYTRESRACYWDLLPCPLLDADRAWRHIDDIAGSPLQPPPTKEPVDDYYGDDDPQDPPRTGDVRWLCGQTTSFQRAVDMAHRLQGEVMCPVVDVRISGLTSEEQVTHVYDAFLSLLPKYMPTIEGIPTELVMAQRLRSLKRLAAQAVINHNLLPVDGSEHRRVPSEIEWFVRGVREQQQEAYEETGKCQLAFRLEIGVDPSEETQEDERDRIADQEDREEEEDDEEEEEEEQETDPVKRRMKLFKFYHRSAIRHRRHSLLSFHPDPKEPVAEYEVSAPKHNKKDVYPFARAIMTAFGDLRDRGEPAKPQAWRSRSGSAGGWLTYRKTETLGVTSKEDPAYRSGPMHWNNVIKVREVACSFFRCFTEQSASKLWEKDSFVAHIVIVGRPAELGLCVEELNNLLQRTSDQDKASEPSYRVDTRCWFSVQAQPSGSLDRNQLKQVMSELVRGTAWMHARLKVPRMSESKHRTEVERIQKLISGKQTNEGLIAELNKDFTTWQTATEGVLNCVIRIDKRFSPVQAFLTSTSGPEEGATKRNEQCELNQRYRQSNEWWKLELGCLECQFRHFRTGPYLHVSNMLCPLHRSVMLSEACSPLPRDQLSPQALNGLIKNRWGRPASEQGGLLPAGMVDAECFSTLFGGLRCGDVTTWFGEKNVTEMFCEDGT